MEGRIEIVIEKVFKIFKIEKVFKIIIIAQYFDLIQQIKLIHVPCIFGGI